MMSGSQSIRFFLFAALVLIGSLLYNKWQEEHLSSVSSNRQSSVAQIPNLSDNVANKEIPTIQMAQPNAEEKLDSPETAIAEERKIKISTDTLNVVIDKMGGDIVQLSLPQYKNIRESVHEDYALLDFSDKRHYIAQSGLASEQGPDTRGKGRAYYETTKESYTLESDKTHLTVDLKTKVAQNIEILKRFTFEKGSYVITVSYIVQNRSNAVYKASFYTRLKRKPETSSNAGLFGMGVQTYTGAAIDTPETPYKKLPFKEIAEKPFQQTFMGGWAAMVEHYFVSAWIPEKTVTSTYQAFSENGVANVGFIENAVTVLPGESKTLSARLYAGPQVTETLSKVAKGLELTVDYGMLWPICQPIFWIIKQLYLLTGNWGIAIILITVLIKLLFYKLSASSYRSMAKMRQLQPKIESLKERYGDDKQKFSQAVMEFYKKEKVNPVGGCLPILIQIPVFIALYYVLLGSVELRLAPFILWITDLSEKDPYYILPILMGLSMVVQQRLNPQPPDPMQAKVMMFMPVIFTALFLNFPSGLVLYWLVSNLLSILQQWAITRKVESSGKQYGVKHERA